MAMAVIAADSDEVARAFGDDFAWEFRQDVAPGRDASVADKFLASGDGIGQSLAACLRRAPEAGC